MCATSDAKAETPKADKTPKIEPWAHVLAVHDIERSARYFCDKLGFTATWNEAPDWRLVQRGGVRVMLGRCPNITPAAELGPHNWFAYLNVDDVDGLHAELAERGAIILRAPTDTSYGMLACPLSVLSLGLWFERR
jgi:predicted enzyme related to lactoylglutathione lyase